LIEGAKKSQIARWSDLEIGTGRRTTAAVFSSPRVVFQVSARQGQGLQRPAGSGGLDTRTSRSSRAADAGKPGPPGDERQDQRFPAAATAGPGAFGPRSGREQAPRGEDRRYRWLLGRLLTPGATRGHREVTNAAPKSLQRHSCYARCRAAREQFAEYQVL